MPGANKTTALWWVLLIALAFPRAEAQPTNAVIEDLQIDLWPEYDRPEVLVMYRFRLRPDWSLETPVSVPVPASVEEPHAVAWKNPSGGLYVAQFTRTEGEDRDLVNIRMGSREGQLEFYRELDIEGSRRSFRFEWPGGVPLGALSLRVQQPAGARDLDIVPALARQSEGEDGLTYALVELGPLESSETPAVEVSYTKETSDLTTAARTTSTTTTRPPSAAPSDDGTFPTWAVALGGLLLAAAGGFLLLTSRGSGAPAAAETPPRESGSAVFCHNCGTKSKAGHKFCRECGTKLVPPE